MSLFRRTLAEGAQLALGLDGPAVASPAAWAERPQIVHSPSHAPTHAPAFRPAPTTAPTTTPKRTSPGSDAARSEVFLERLRAHGLREIDRLRLTRNRTVMVSFSGRELRVHKGYLDAPPEVLRSIVTFVCGRTRADRKRARESILTYHVERPTGSRRPEGTRPEDMAIVERLVEMHARYNTRHFAGRLRRVPVRVSYRMKSRLGHYTAASPTGEPAEIVISREHIRRHGWEEALHTLLHEMVHQWQDEAGHSIDHGSTFRSKSREVGIIPYARRTVVPRRSAAARTIADGSHQHVIGLRAAREE
jgi:hypothetical protein